MSERLPTLRSKLAIRAFSLTLVGVLAVMSIGGVITDRVMASDVKTAASAYLSIIVAELRLADAPTDAGVLVPLEQAGADRHAQIVDLATGEVVAASSGWEAPVVDLGSIGEEPVTFEAASGAESDQQVAVAMRTVEVNGSRYGVMAAIDVPAGLVGLNWQSLAALLAALVIAGGVGLVVWYSVRYAMRPVEDLAGQAETVAGPPWSPDWALESQVTTDEIDGLTTRLNSLLSHVHESQVREREFLEDASHDLRTPIAVARAELDLATSTTTDPQTKASLKSAIEELDRLDRLTADLLILAKVRAQTTQAHEQIRLGHLVRKTTARLIRDPHQRQVTISVEGGAAVRGDSLTLERALENILSNAIRYADSGVEVGVRESGDMASVCIRDDGPGFDTTILADAKERFARDTSRREGTGLGLAIASAIAEAHGGSVEIRNLRGGGAEVTLRLPASTGHGDPEPILSHH